MLPVVLTTDNHGHPMRVPGGVNRTHAETDSADVPPTTHICHRCGFDLRGRIDPSVSTLWCPSCGHRVDLTETPGDSIDLEPGERQISRASIWIVLGALLAVNTATIVAMFVAELMR